MAARRLPRRLTFPLGCEKRPLRDANMCRPYDYLVTLKRIRILGGSPKTNHFPHPCFGIGYAEKLNFNRKRAGEPHFFHVVLGNFRRFDSVAQLNPQKDVF